MGSSSIAMTQAGTSFYSRQSYYPYGAQRTTEGTALPTDYSFTGQKSDDSTGLMFYNARYYDTTLGRFTQPDTIVPNPLNPQSLNRFAYVLNNPLKYTDPTGHVECWDEDCDGGPSGGGGGNGSSNEDETEDEEGDTCNLTCLDDEQDNPNQDQVQVENEGKDSSDQVVDLCATASLNVGLGMNCGSGKETQEQAKCKLGSPDCPTEEQKTALYLIGVGHAGFVGGATALTAAVGVVACAPSLVFAVVCGVGFGIAGNVVAEQAFRGIVSLAISDPDYDPEWREFFERETIYAP